MKYFLLQRLHSKNHNLDKFDFLDEYSTKIETFLPNYSLSDREKTKNPELPINSLHLSTRLFLENFSSQRVKSLSPTKYSSIISTLVTLRRDKFFNLFDVCLNSKSLLVKLASSKLIGHSELSFNLNSVSDDSLLINNISKPLVLKGTKIVLLSKCSHVLAKEHNRRIAQ